MAHLLVLGGHGRVALLLERLLADEGDRVSAVIRDPSQSDDVRAAGAEPVVLDIEKADVGELASLVEGHDAVVWAAGAGGGDSRRTYAVDRDAAERTMQAAALAGVRRFVMVSWLGSRAEHGVDPDDAFFPYADAKWQADEHLQASRLDATIVAPGTLTDDAPTGRIALDPPGSGRVSRADVAAVVAAVLADPSTAGRTIRFGAGDVPIAEALTR